MQKRAAPALHTEILLRLDVVLDADANANAIRKRLTANDFITACSQAGLGSGKSNCKGLFVEWQHSAAAESNQVAAEY